MEIGVRPYKPTIQVMSVRVTAGARQVEVDLSLWDQLGIIRGSTIVDVGYGRPEELLVLSELVGSNGLIYGIEPEIVTRDTSKKPLSDHPNVRVMTGDARKIPVANESADLVLLKGVLHEIYNVSTALAEAKRVCGREGKVAVVDFMTFPLNWMRWSNFKWNLSHWKTVARSPDKHPGFAKAELDVCFRHAGLRIERYVENVAPGKFEGHAIPMFVAIASRIGRE